MSVASLQQICLNQLAAQDLPILQDFKGLGFDAYRIACSSMSSLERSRLVRNAMRAELCQAVTAEDYPKIWDIYRQSLYQLESECASRGIQCHKSMLVERPLLCFFFAKMRDNLSRSLAREMGIAQSRHLEVEDHTQEILAVFGDQLPVTCEQGIALMDQLLTNQHLGATVASLLKLAGPPPSPFFECLITHYPHAIDAILPLAILWVDAEIVQQLLKKGANPNHMYEGEVPLLSMAVEVSMNDFKSHEDLEKCIELLLQYGASTSLPWRDNLPLHNAVQRPYFCFEGIVRLLLKYSSGADLHFTNGDYRTPLGMAVDPRMRALFLNYGVHPEVEEEIEGNEEGVRLIDLNDPSVGSLSREDDDLLEGFLSNTSSPSFYDND